ncbi:MAG: GNAT family N-acetyltransferase [Myxococcota bacterium]
MTDARVVLRDLTDAELARRIEGGRRHAIASGSVLVDSNRITVVLLDGEAFVGCAVAELYHHAQPNGWAYLEELFLEVPYRKRGLGALMLRAIEARAWSRGARRIWTRTAGYEAPDFYARQGYTRCYELENQFCSGDSKVGFRKALTPPTTTDVPASAFPGSLRLVERAMTETESHRIAEGFVEHARAFGNPPQSHERYGLVALAGGDFVGCVSGLALREGEGYNRWFVLTDLFVESSHRGRGLGTALLDGMERHIATLGIESVSLWMAGYQSPTFFLAHDYEIFCTFEDWYPGDFDRLGLRKTLAR